MKKLLLGLALSLFASVSFAQQVTTPAIVALACAYNSGAQTGTSGQFMYVQCDVNGKLLTSTGGTGVTAAAVLTANQLVVGDDGVRGVKTANATITGTYTFAGPTTFGVITNATSLALGGATIGTNALAWTGTALGLGLLTITQATANSGILASTGYSLTGSSAVGAIDIAGTWNTSGSPTAIKVNITQTAIGGTTRFLSFQDTGTDRFFVTAGGGATATGLTSTTNIGTADGGYIGWPSSRALMKSPADGQLLVTLNVGTNGFKLGASATDGLMTLGTQAGGSGNALGSINLTNLTGTGTIIIGTADAASSTGGALQITGGASVAKRFWIPAITTSAGLQTAVLCQSSGGEMIADSVACLASSEKFKEDIAPSDMGLATVLALKPIVYRYRETGNERFDNAPNQRAIHAGFSAEQAASVDSRLVAYDADGNIRTIRPDAVPAALVRAVQELSSKIERLEAR